MRLIRLKWGFDKNHYNCHIKFILGLYMFVLSLYVTLCAYIEIYFHMINFGTLIHLCGCFIMHIWFNMCSHVIICFGIVFAHIHKYVPCWLYVFHTYMLFWIILFVWIIMLCLCFCCIALFISSHILICLLIWNVDVLQYSCIDFGLLFYIPCLSWNLVFVIDIFWHIFVCIYID